MPVFGNRPDDVMQDKAGNAQSGVSIVLYATQSDATAQVSPLGTATTDSNGRWPITLSGYQVWARDPAGNVWAVAAEDAVGTFGTSITDHETRLGVAEATLLNKEDKQSTYRATGAADEKAALAAFLATSTPLGVKRVIGSLTVAGSVSVPANTYVDISAATITQTSNSSATFTCAGAGGQTIIGGGSGRIVGKGDYVAGTPGTPTAIGVSVSAPNVTVAGLWISNHAGTGIYLVNATAFKCSNTRITGVSPALTIPALDSSCFGVYMNGGCSDLSFSQLDVSGTSIGLISSIDTTHLSLANSRFHDITGQHGAYIQNGTGLNINGIDAWNINLNAVKTQLNSSTAADSHGMSITNITANDCGDCALSVNNITTDLTGSYKYRGVTISNIAAYNCARALYLGSVYGGTVTNISGYSLVTDGLTVIDCQDVEISGVSTLSTGRRGVLYNTQTGALTQRVKLSNVKVRDPATLNVASSQYGVHISGNGGSDMVDLTFDGVNVTSTNGNMIYGFYNAAGDQATMTLRNVTLKNAVTADIRAMTGPLFFKELTNVRYTTQVNMPVQGQTNMAPNLALNNLVAETYDSVLATLAQSLMTAGVLYAARLYVPQERLLSTIWYAVATVGAGLTASQNLIGVYDAAGALIAQTGDQSSNFASPGNRSAALTTPVTVPAGSYIHIGVLFNGTTSPALRGINGTSIPNVNLATVSQSRFATGGTAQTALPSTMPVLTANNAANSAPWFGIA